jgi:hypothetical protein
LHVNIIVVVYLDLVNQPQVYDIDRDFRVIDVSEDFKDIITGDCLGHNPSCQATLFKLYELSTGLVNNWDGPVMLG